MIQARHLGLAGAALRALEDWSGDCPPCLREAARAKVRLGCPITIRPPLWSSCCSVARVEPWTAVAAVPITTVRRWLHLLDQRGVRLQHLQYHLYVALARSNECSRHDLLRAIRIPG